MIPKTPTRKGWFCGDFTDLLSKTEVWRVEQRLGRVQATMIGLQSTALLQQRPTRWK